MAVNPLKWMNIDDIAKKAKSMGKTDAQINAAKVTAWVWVKPPTTPTNTNVYGDVSGASTATKNQSTGVSTATKGLQMKPEDFVYWEAAKQKESTGAWYLQQRNDQLATDFYGKWMKDEATIRAELSKNAWFSAATPEEQANTIQGIMNRMGSMTPTTAPTTPTAPVEGTAGKYKDSEGNLVDILWYNDLPDDMKQLVDGMSDADKKMLDMQWGNDVNGKLEYLRQAKRTQEYLQQKQDTTVKIRDLEGNILEIQASQRLRDGAKQVDNLIQNLWYLGTRGQPWKSSVALWAAKGMVEEAVQKYNEMKTIEQKVAQIRALGIEMDTAAYEKQMADISDDLNMKVGMQIQNAMNEMSAADMAGQLDTIDWVTQFKRDLFAKLDANITGYTEGSMKQMQYITEQYTKMADDAQTRLTEWTTNANTVNTEMSAARGYYVDGNGNPLYNADGTTISLPEKPPMEPVWDKESGQLITFSLDESGQIVAKVQQVTDQVSQNQQAANSIAQLVANGTMSMSDVPAEMKWAVAIAMANMKPTTDTGYQWPEVAPVDTNKVDSALSQIEAKPDGSIWGQCGSFVNDYLQDMGLGRLFIDPIDAKKTVKNSEIPTVGSVAIFDWSNNPNATLAQQKYGHVGIVTAVNWGKITVKQSNNKGNEQVFTSTYNAKDAYGFFDPSKGLKPTTWNASILDSAVKAISLAQFPSEKARESAIKDIKSLANSWDVNAVQKKLTNIFLSDLWATEKQAFKTNQNTINAMKLISQKLENIPTSWMNGWFEKLAQKIGESNDPELAKLQIVTNNALDILRRWRSWAALTEFEEQFYNTMFPTISKSFKLNEATIEWLVESLQNNIDSNIQEYYGDDVFNNIWKWQSSNNTENASNTSWSSNVDNYR